jgi:hypothetical protein
MARGVLPARAPVSFRDVAVALFLVRSWPPYASSDARRGMLAGFGMAFGAAAMSATFCVLACLCTSGQHAKARGRARWGGALDSPGRLWAANLLSTVALYFLCWRQSVVRAKNI